MLNRLNQLKRRLEMEPDNRALARQIGALTVRIDPTVGRSYKLKRRTVHQEGVMLVRTLSEARFEVLALDTVEVTMSTASNFPQVNHRPNTCALTKKKARAYYRRLKQEGYR